VTGTAITKTEAARLAELEAVVERGVQTFFDVGNALTEIREARLYRDSHATFEAYLDERWSMSRARGYQLIDAAAVSTVVDKAGLPALANEAQARELVPVLKREGEEAVRDLLREAQAQGVEINATAIRDLKRMHTKAASRKARTDGLRAQRGEAARQARENIRMHEMTDAEWEARCARNARSDLITELTAARGQILNVASKEAAARSAEAAARNTLEWVTEFDEEERSLHDLLAEAEWHIADLVREMRERGEYIPRDALSIEAAYVEPPDEDG
jgi:hypothetical protein